MRLLASFVLALSLFACTTFSAEPPPAPRELVVLLRAAAESGSAVRLAPGTLLTARHVATIDSLRLNGVAVDGAVLAPEPALDIATVNSILATCPCAELAPTDAVQDEPVVVIGWPHGAFLQVQHGIAQGVTDFAFGRRLVISAIIAPGFSGGGVFAFREGRWQLVGITTEASRSAAFAVPISDIKQWLGENDGRSK